jgi:hypothetical protein
MPSGRESCIVMRDPNTIAAGAHDQKYALSIFAVIAFTAHNAYGLLSVTSFWVSHMLRLSIKRRDKVLYC